MAGWFDLINASSFQIAQDKVRRLFEERGKSPPEPTNEHIITVQCVDAKIRDLVLDITDEYETKLQSIVARYETIIAQLKKGQGQ
jgi:hypothetical protein